MNVLKSGLITSLVFGVTTITSLFSTAQAATYKTFSDPKIGGRYVDACITTSSNSNNCSQSAFKTVADKVCREYGYDKAVSQSRRRKNSSDPVSKLTNGSWTSHSSGFQDVISSVKCGKATFKTFSAPKIGGRYVDTCTATSSNDNNCSQSAFEDVVDKVCREYGYDKAVSQSYRRKNSSSPVSKLTNGSWTSHSSGFQDVISSVKCRSNP
jgi:hypothetical protein